MRIVVDLNKCQGYAQCVPLAPDVLKLLGDEALAYDPNPDDSQRQRVMRAAASCPVQAIIVETYTPRGAGVRNPLVAELVDELPGRGPHRHRGRFAGRPAGRGNVARAWFSRAPDTDRRRAARAVRPAPAVQAGPQRVGSRRSHQAAAVASGRRRLATGRAGDGPGPGQSPGVTGQRRQG